MIERARPSTPLVQHRHMNRFVVLLFVGMVLGRPHAAEDDDASVEAIGLALRQEGVVTGAPYCASLVRETVTLRADGRRNVQRQRMPMCRDGEGRTRREVQPDGGPRRIVLNDPIARTAWVLEPERQIARALVLTRTVQQDPAALARQQQAMTERQRTLDERRSALARVLAQQAEWDWPASPGAGDARALARRGDGVTTPLPEQVVEGLTVTGERTTWTLPAALPGSPEPIVIVREVWRSPALQVTVRLHERDPRHGEVIERLEQVRRGEPDSALMRVPADFQRQTPGRP